MHNFYRGLRAWRVLHWYINHTREVLCIPEKVSQNKIVKHQVRLMVQRKSDKFIVPMKQVMTVEGRDLRSN